MRAAINTLTAQLSQARRAQGRTQAAIASAIGYTQCAVSAWERGHAAPGADALTAWATALGYQLTLTPTKITKGMQ